MEEVNQKSEEFCTCGNPTKEGFIHYDGEEKLIYVCVDCNKIRKFDITEEI